MNPKRRIYSLPYNGTNPEWFLQEVEKRKQNIDHVYCELPFKEMISHVRFTFDDRKSAGENPADVDAMRALYLKNCFEFLRLSRGKVRRICPVNAMCYPFAAEDEVKNFVVMLARAAKELQLEGFILSDYRVAALLHALLPEAEIHTSCNAYQWNLRLMQRLPMESAANGNLAGEMWRDRIQSPPGNPQEPKQAERDARRRVPAQMSCQRSLPDGLPEFLQSQSRYCHGAASGASKLLPKRRGRPVPRQLDFAPLAEAL